MSLWCCILSSSTAPCLQFHSYEKWLSALHVSVRLFVIHVLRCAARAASWLSVRVSHRSDPEERSEPSHRTFPCLTHVKRESTLCWSISKAGGLKVRDASLKIILLHWARECYKCCVYCSKSHLSCKPSCLVCMSSIYIPYAHCIVCYNLKMGSDSCVSIRSVSNYFTHRFLLCDFTKHLIRRAECVMPDGLLYWKYFEFFHAWSVFFGMWSAHSRAGGVSSGSNWAASKILLFQTSEWSSVRREPWNVKHIWLSPPVPVYAADVCYVQS